MTIKLVVVTPEMCFNRIFFLNLIKSRVKPKMETRLVVCARDYLNALSASTSQVLPLSQASKINVAHNTELIRHQYVQISLCCPLLSTYFSSGTSVYRWFYRYIYDNNDANRTVYNRQVAKLLLKQKKHSKQT